MCTYFHRKSSVFPVIKNSNFRIFPKSSPRCFFGDRKCGKKLEKHRISFEIRCFYGCGGRTRTYDLRVMSPTSFQLLYSAIWALLECLGIIAHPPAFVNTIFPSRVLPRTTAQINIFILTFTGSLHIMICKFNEFYTSRRKNHVIFDRNHPL